MVDQLPPAGTPVALRSLALPTVALGAVAAAAFAMVTGMPALWSAIAGVAVVVSFFAITHVVLQRVLSRAPHLAMGAAMLLYVSKIAAMLALVVVLRNISGLDGKAFGITVLACTLVWTVSETVVNLRHRTLYVDTDADIGSAINDQE